MRIINGRYKNRRFNIPKNLKIRPTTDKAKESLFNILENMVNFNEIKTLDLFSGSGNISYEFFSRGSSVTSVDSNIKCIKFISNVSKNYGMDFSIIKKDVFNYLNSSKLKFDIVFADPPYNMPKNNYCKLIKLIFEKNIISNNGIIVIEHSSFLNFEKHEKFFKSKKYGDVNFSFLINKI